MDGENEVVIVGGGGAGLVAALNLKRTLPWRRGVRVTLVDQSELCLTRNLFREFINGKRRLEDICVPLEMLLEGKDIDFVKARTNAIDLAGRRVKTDGGIIDYDYLLLAPGAAADFRETSGAREHAFTLRGQEEAEELRDHIRAMLESASKEKDERERKAMLTFMIAGGGLAGVEFATSLAEWLDELRLSYWVSPEELEVVIVETMDEVVPRYPEWVRHEASQGLRELGVRVVQGTSVAKVTPTHALLSDGSKIATKTVVWSAGIKPGSLLSEMGLDVDSSGRVIVDRYMRTGFSGVYAAGDATTLVDEDGSVVPMVERSAVKEGLAAAHNIYADITGGRPKNAGGKSHHLLYFGEKRRVVAIGDIALPRPIANLVDKMRCWIAFFMLGGTAFLPRYRAWLAGEETNEPASEEWAA